MFFDINKGRRHLASDLILIPVKDYTGPGFVYDTNLIDIMRDVTHPDVRIDFVFGSK